MVDLYPRPSMTPIIYYICLIVFTEHYCWLLFCVYNKDSYFYSTIQMYVVIIIYEKLSLRIHLVDQIR